MRSGLRFLWVVSLCIGLAVPVLARSESLTTTFAGGNSQNGNMFDAVTGSSDLTITSMTFSVANFVSGSFAIYTTPGSYATNATNSSAWTQVYSGRLTFNSATNTGDISGLDIALAANTTTGIYVTFTDSGYLSYTDGSSSFSGTDLTLNMGYGVAYAFGSDYSPREWNGTIDYTLGSVAPTPEPSSLALLLTGILGAACLIGIKCKA